MNKKYEIIVIGGGGGGLQCAIHATSRGAQCAIIDKMEVGGECLHYGCIPTKSMVRSMDVYRVVQSASTVGVEIEGNVDINFSKIMDRQKEIVNGIVDRVHKGLASMRIDFYDGVGSIVSPDKVNVKLNKPEPGQGNEITIETENIVIATGSSPNMLSIPGADLPGVITNREIFDIKKLPKSIVIIGCGYIGVEFATIFSSMGTRTTMLEKYDFLRGFDENITRIIRKGITERQGVNVDTDVDVFEIHEIKRDLYEVVYEKDGQRASAQGEIVLMATGRTPYTDNLLSGDFPIAMDGPGIKVNEHLETSVAGIYAIGDVLNGAMTAFTAGTEGEIASNNCLGKKVCIDYSAIPRCIFTYPAYSCVGVTEAEAQSTKNLDFGLAEYPFKTTPMAEIMNETEGFTRLIYEKGSGKILGGHVLGTHSSELIAELTLAVRKELTVKDLAYLFHFHPSLSENVQRAARVGWAMDETGK